ncbi:MAG: flagellar biosynthetic protein FliO [Spirochaetales bacterium]|nr:flagellar biosynthetic protein FliO [Spirochaetales bacterium]
MKKCLIAGIVAAILLIGPSLAFGQTGDLPENEEDILIQDVETASPERTGGMSAFGAWDIIRMILILACVVAAIYGVFYIVKKAGGPRFQNNELIKIHAGQALSNNASVHLVEVGRQLFLIGSGEHGARLIATLEDKETVDEIHLRVAAGGSAAKKSFQEVLSGLFHRPAGQNMEDYQRPEDFLGKQRERLKKL